jgi:hypothetical protein
VVASGVGVNVAEGAALLGAVDDAVEPELDEPQAASRTAAEIKSAAWARARDVFI